VLYMTDGSSMTNQTASQVSISQWPRPSIVPVSANENATSTDDRTGVTDPRRILLVEDDFMLRGSLTEFLQGEGYRVESSANGVDALRRLERPPRPALILLDIMLPYMDGLEFRAVQRMTREISDIPVIVITAVGVQPAVAKELDLRQPFFKPLDMPKLLAAIERVCPPDPS
jgi:CheY-like chemotaxis protein